jgi:hypothetical protein
VICTLEEDWQAKTSGWKQILIGEQEVILKKNYHNSLAKANFNWRWKFPMTIPVDPREYKGDILKVFVV